MAHLHDVYDTDRQFSIDIVSRTIKNNSTSKTTLMQYDHNSERFSFEMPRYIEGHDMLECDGVEVHYVNGTNGGIYKVQDLQVHKDDETKVVCSWLISQNATQIVGALDFLLRFYCTTDGEIDYVWNTSIFKGITITKGIYNENIVAEQYTETIKAWENRLKAVENSVGSSGISPIVNVTPIQGGNRVVIVDANGTKAFNIMDGANGVDGQDGKDGVNGTNGLNGRDGANGQDGISPTISVAAISGGKRVTITDKNGTKSFDVMDGLDGEGGITSEDDPTVPTWAKQSEKPTYTASEVGAVTENEVLALINAKLGVIENGTY